MILIMACVLQKQLKCYRKDTKIVKEGVACKSGNEANSIRMEVGCVAYRSGNEVTQ